MRKNLALAVAVVMVTAIAALSPSAALEVTVSSSKSSFVQGEPIYVWVDYYNDTGDEIGLPDGYLFGYDVLKVWTRDGKVVVRPGLQVTRPPLGTSNRIQRIGPKEHVVFYANLLDHVNLTDAESYDIQVFMPNHKPELFLDPKHPALPESKLVRGPIQSNHWKFTIEPGNGEAFDIVAKPLRDKTAGTFALCQNAGVIVEKYPSSPYWPYAVMCKVADLLYGEGHGPVPLEDRLVSARALMDELRNSQTGFEYRDIAMIRYAERLAKLGQNSAASKLLSELQGEEGSDVAKLYIGQVLSRRSETK